MNNLIDSVVIVKWLNIGDKISSFFKNSPTNE